MSRWDLPKCVVFKVLIKRPSVIAVSIRHQVVPDEGIKQHTWALKSVS